MARPSWVASAVLRALCCVVDVSDAPSAERQVTCRFLLSLYVMDSIGWVCFKIVQFESIIVVSAADLMSTVLFVTLLTTLETTIEIVASSLVPRCFALVEHRSDNHPGALAVFTMKAYTASTFGALLLAAALSPCLIGGAVDEQGRLQAECDVESCSCGASDEVCGRQGTTHARVRPDSPITPQACGLEWIESNTTDSCCRHGGEEKLFCPISGSSTCLLKPAALSIVLVVSYCFLYCIMNQLGDASRQIGQANWLAAFEGTRLVVPGFASGARGGWRRAISMRRPASEDACSLHFQLLKLTWEGIAALVYIGVRESPILRFGLLVFFAAIGVASGGAMLCNGRDSASGASHFCIFFPASPPAVGVGRDAPAFSLPHILRTKWPATPAVEQPERMEEAGSRDAGAPTKLVLWPWKMAPWEVSLSLFMVCSRGLPQQAADTVSAYIASSPKVTDSLAYAIDGGSKGGKELAKVLIAPIAAVFWGITMLVLVRKLKGLPTSFTCPIEPHCTSGVNAGAAPLLEVAEGPARRATHSLFGSMLRLAWGLFCVLTISGALLAIPSWASLDAGASSGLILGAIFAFVPFLPLSKLLMAPSIAVESATMVMAATQYPRL